MERGLFSSNRMDWETPQALFDELNAEFGFSLDAAASESNAKCPRFFTERENGLIQSWGGECVFCNPPYGRHVAEWAKKALSESKKPGTVVVLLVASRTDTAWFHDFIWGHAREVRFIRGRLRFETGGVAGNPAPFPSLIAIYGDLGVVHE